jgi:hypothetical protein
MPVFDLNQQAEIIHPLPTAANLNVRFGQPIADISDVQAHDLIPPKD